MTARHHVFVLGCQRSGTTLLGEILGAHPRAVLVDEDDRVYDLIEALLGDAPNQAHVMRRCLASARKHYRDRRRIRRNGTLDQDVTHVVLKAPNATYEVDRLRRRPELRPHVVFAARDARDVVASMQRLSHIPMVENQLARLSASPELSARFAAEVRQIRAPGTPDHVRRALIWAIKTGLYRDFTSPPLEGLLVRYEDLVAEPETWIEKVLNHVGLPTDAAGPAHHETVLRGVGPGATDRTRPVDASSVGRWIGQLSPRAEQQVWDVAAGLMAQLGYPRDPPRRSGAPPAAAAPDRDRPIVATGRGGSGTRLLSELLQELGAFLGTDLNESEDSVEWVEPIYGLAIAKLSGEPAADAAAALVDRAQGLLATEAARRAGRWGWKLPETMLVLPEVAGAFPGAQFLHLVRHPVDTCLRRTHVTSRANSRIGRAALGAAYRWLGWDRDPAGDPDWLRNAASWVFQVETAARFGRSLDPRRYLEITFEDLCAEPQRVADRVAAFLDVPAVWTSLGARIDPARTRASDRDDDRAGAVWEICGETAAAFGYRYPA